MILGLRDHARPNKGQSEQKVLASVNVMDPGLALRAIRDAIF